MGPGKKPKKRSSRKESRLRKVVTFSMRWCSVVLAMFVALTVLEVFTVRLVNPPVTVPMVLDWIGAAVRGKSYRSPAYNWVNSSDISIYLKKAVLAAEDQRFRHHNGFDFTELGIAFQDLLFNRKVRGASTITMQAARTVFLWPDRTVVRKFAEAYYTVLMEWLLSKERILELYLNTVDWGDGVMGVDAAAWKYFQTAPGRLTRDQAVRLASILPNPHQWSPNQSSPYLEQRRQRIARDMAAMPDL